MAQVGVAPIRVVLADGDPDRAAHLCDLLIADPALQPVGIASDVAEVTPLLSQAPDILLVATDLTNPAALVQLIKQVAASAASTQVLLIGEDIDTGLLQRSVVAGARAVLVAPFEASELRETIRQVHESHLERHAGQQRAPATQRKSGAVIVIFSPKGGVGCSVLACNVAMALHQATNKRVALLDYSLQFGTIGALLNLQSPRTLGELLPHAAAIDTMMLNATLLTHSSEIKVLLPPATLEELEDVTTENLLDILDGVRRRFDYTVVDIWHTVEDATLAIMEAADQLLLVTTPEAPAIDSLRRFLGMVKDQPHLRPKMKLVVNRYPSSGGLDLGEIENRLGLHSVATVPSDGEGINVAINVGLSVGQKTIAGVSGPKLRALAEALALPADLGPAPSSSTPAPRWRFSLHRPPRDDARGA